MLSPGEWRRAERDVTRKLDSSTCSAKSSSFGASSTSEEGGANVDEVEAHGVEEAGEEASCLVTRREAHERSVAYNRRNCRRSPA